MHDRALATARRLCRTADEGEDLLHEAVMHAYCKLPALREEGRFRAWFYAVLLSRHRSRARRGFWRRFLPLEDERERSRGATGEDGGRWEERRIRARRLARALATLPAAQREAIVLHDVDGYVVREIAAMQRSSAPAVESRLSRGRRKLTSPAVTERKLSARRREHSERNGIMPIMRKLRHRPMVATSLVSAAAALLLVLVPVSSDADCSELEQGGIDIRIDGEQIDMDGARTIRVCGDRDMSDFEMENLIREQLEGKGIDADVRVVDGRCEITPR